MIVLSTDDLKALKMRQEAIATAQHTLNCLTMERDAWLQQLAQADFATQNWHLDPERGVLTLLPNDEEKGDGPDNPGER